MMNLVVFSLVILPGILRTATSVLSTTEPNKPVSSTDDLRRQFDIDRKIDQAYARQPDTPFIDYGYERPLSDLARTPAEQDPKFPAGALGENSETTSVTPSQAYTVEQHQGTFHPTSSSSTKPNSIQRLDEKDTFITQVTASKSSKGLERLSEFPFVQEQEPNRNEDRTSNDYVNVKSRLHKPELYRGQNNGNTMNNPLGLTTTTSFPGQNPKAQKPDNDFSWLIVLPVAVISFACIMAVSLGVLILCACRRPKKPESGLKTTGCLGNQGVAHDRSAMYQDACRENKTPEQCFWSKGTHYWANIVDNMPENLLNDKTVYVDPKSEKIVNDGTESGHRLSPLNILTGVENEFYLSILHNENSLKTPAGLGDDAGSDYLGPDSKLAFVSVSLEDDETKQSPTTPTDGSPIGHTTHM